jgi:hypothetical protein
MTSHSFGSVSPGVTTTLTPSPGWAHSLCPPGCGRREGAGLGRAEMNACTSRTDACERAADPRPHACIAWQRSQRGTEEEGPRVLLWAGRTEPSNRGSVDSKLHPKRATEGPNKRTNRLLQGTQAGLKIRAASLAVCCIVGSRSLLPSNHATHTVSPTCFVASTPRTSAT